MMPNETIRVLIAEDNPSLVSRYEMILRKDPTFELIESATSGYEAVLFAAIHKPDIILMDIEMESRESGIIASRQILSQLPSIRIIILTVYEDDEFVFSAFKAGVIDYLLKNANPEEIIRSIKDAYHGCSPIRPVIANKIRREFMRVKKREDSYLFHINWVMELSESEIAILLLLAQGKTRSQICQERQVELSTVKTQIRNILRKLQFRSVQEVVDVIRDYNLVEFLKQAHKRKESNMNTSGVKGI